MHGYCAGFRSDEELLSKTKEACSNVGVRVCTRDACPSCFASVVAQHHNTSIIESRATLIVTPPAILTQWSREIRRHTKDHATGKPLKVAIYPGVKDLCCAGSRAPHKDFHLVHPNHLANADVVLVTFQALMSDLWHSNDNPLAGFSTKNEDPRLRSKKRYKVLPSPLTSVKWWRVCLDEAQRVEVPSAASARMAHKLLTDKRWCVTGTPIGDGHLDDLYGLLLFLSFKPFAEKRWFSKTFSLSHGDALNRLSHLLKDIMWRSTKASRFVRQQMGVPEQVEKKNILQFSSVEKHFYDIQYEKTYAAVSKSTNAKRSDLPGSSIQTLRQACCHPQVGKSGIQGSPDQVLSMDQILEKLIEDARGKCEKAQRNVTDHTNGLAGLIKLKAANSDDKKKFLEESLNMYQKALDLEDTNALPTEVIGPAVLSGSRGFLLNQKTMQNGAATLEWQIDKSTASHDVWSIIDIAGPAKTINCIKIQTCQALQGDLATSWTILRPKDCVLQMLSATVGGDFVNVHTFTLADVKDTQEISGFYAKNSKAWRLKIRSYYNTLTSDSCQYTRLDVQLFEPEIVVHSLKRIHTLHNASIVLSSLAQAGNGILGDIVREREKYCKEMNDLSKDTDRSWYEDCLAWFAHNGDEQDQNNLLETVRRDLSNYYERAVGEAFERENGVSGGSLKVLVRTGKFPTCDTVDRLRIALAMRIQQGVEEVGLRKDMTQKNCMRSVLNLSSTPKEEAVYKNLHCPRCRKDWGNKQTGPVCRPTKSVWMAHFDLLSVIHQLNQCKCSMRLRQEGEDISELTKNEAALIVDPASMAAELVEHEMKRDTALAVLRKNKGSLQYLKNLRLKKQRRERSAVGATNQTNASNASDICAVCLSAFEFDSERSVLPCGHMLHPICVDELFKRSSCSTIQCLECQMVVRREDTLLASNMSKEDGSRTSGEIKGDWGTKVNHLIGDVLDMGDTKGVIFSLWDEVLDIVATALGANHVRYIRPRSGKRFGEDIKRFQTSDVPIVLMNLKNGAEGLTLTEANHVFMVEPILDCGLDMQVRQKVKYR
ncbi:hypothetical protein ACHAXR_007093 [Thalassiosira sp. AJA248-18]